MPRSTVTPTPTPTITPTITPTTSETPTPTIDETADWSTYTNTTYGFSFKYPNIWTLENTDPKAKDTYFRFQLKLGEVVTGDVFDKNTNSTDSNTRKVFTLQNDKTLLVVYAQCLGSGCGLGSLDIPTFTKFLSTFKFLNQEEIPAISQAELSRGWYYGTKDQKKPNTPTNWTNTEAGKSACWHEPNFPCPNFPPD